MALTKVTSALTDLDGGITIDNITIDGTEIDLSSGDLTIDVAGNLQIDADDNGEIRFLDGGTQFATIKKDGNNALFQSIVADGDFVIQGIDGSSFVTAVTFDMSDSGRALFSYGANIPFVASADGTVIATFTNSARVGIGTTSPQDTVDIRGNILQVGGSPEIHIGTTSSSHYNWRIAAQEVVDTGFEIAVGTQSAGSDAASDTYSTKFTLLANGKCGIGETDPLGVLHIKDGDGGSFTPNESANTLVLEEDDNCGLTILSGNNDNGMIAFGDTNDSDVGSILYDHNVGALSFTTEASERMRIASNGQVMIARTTAVSSDIRLNMTADASVSAFGTANSGTGNNYIGIFRNSSGTAVGTIIANNSNVAFNTSSDYRLKENVTDMTNATTRLKQLKPKRFNFIADETNTLVDGFLAHEVSSIVPEAIMGEKDGNIMQGIDQSKLVPLLVKTIQELEARITTLEG